MKINLEKSLKENTKVFNFLPKPVIDKYNTIIWKNPRTQEFWELVDKYEFNNSTKLSDEIKQIQFDLFIQGLFINLHKIDTGII